MSLREIKQHLARYVKAAEAGERIVITRRSKPVALLSPLPRQEQSLTAAQEAALERILSQSHHLGGRAPSRNDPDFHEAMQAFEEVRRQYRNTLEKLAE